MFGEGSFIGVGALYLRCGTCYVIEKVNRKKLYSCSNRKLCNM